MAEDFSSWNGFSGENNIESLARYWDRYQNGPEGYRQYFNRYIIEPGQLNGIDVDTWKTFGDWYNRRKATLAAEQNISNAKKDANDAAEAANVQAQQAASKAYQSAISAGVGKGKAGMLGDNTAAGSSQSTNTAAMQNSLASQRTSTQADYLQAMGQVQGMQNQASNLEKGSGYAALTGGLTGAATGASAGFMTSDERCKDALPEADVEDALRKVDSIEYKYKEPLDDGEEHVGVTAQSLEDGAFDDVVSEDENGIKQLDKQMLLEAVMAGIASLQKEIDELKGVKENG